MLNLIKDIKNMLRQAADNPLTELVIQISIKAAGVSYDHLILMPQIMIADDGSYTITAARTVLRIPPIETAEIEILDHNNYLLRFANFNIAITVFEIAK